MGRKEKRGVANCSQEAVVILRERKGRRNKKESKELCRAANARECIHSTRELLGIRGDNIAQHKVQAYTQNNIRNKESTSGGLL